MTNNGRVGKIPNFEEQLGPFLSRNLQSKVEKRGRRYYVANAWDNEFTSFLLEPNTESDLIATLNNIILPPRFTALYHLDTNTMEYIYTLLDRNSPYVSRKFGLILEDERYECWFDDASARLLLLSKLFRPSGDRGDDRNLMLLNMYTNPKLSQSLGWEKDFLKGRKPVSFFVGEFKTFDEEKIVEVSKHVNFFMQYYDRSSPITLIHPRQSSEQERVRQLQFIEAGFPKEISTQRKNPFLLDLALAANEAENRLRFIYYYQIIENAAFYFVDDETRRNLTMIINTPDIHSDPDKYIPKILDVVSESRQEDEPKVEKVIKACCTADIVWKELAENMAYFCRKQEFDGGFVLEPFVSENMTTESFCAMWHPKTANTLRYIRNALVHGREKRTGMVILPTQENARKIVPWLPVIRRIAEQVIIFQ